jgi:membrane associated rhomboid family serine protease
MIPLRDINPRHTAPVFTALLILANVAVFLFQASLSNRAEQSLIFSLGIVPARVEALLETHPPNLPAALLPYLTSMFLHGGFLHLLGNMWFLWVFGDNVEDRMGHLRYLFFYAVCGFAAGAIHTYFNWGEQTPAIGASGAISGVMGAYLVLFPRRRVVTLVPLVIFFFTIELPAVVLLGYWFLIQFVSGVGELGMRGSGGVAWWAHIGGFVTGLLLAGMLTPKRRGANYAFGS